MYPNKAPGLILLYAFCDVLSFGIILCPVCRRIRAYLPEGKEAYHQGGEPEATKLNKEKLKSLELEQQVSGKVEFKTIMLSVLICRLLKRN